jgi:hypothetical protein
MSSLFLLEAAGMGLDFLNSIAVPVDTKVEWLASAEDLLAGASRLDWCPTTCWTPFGRALFPENSTPLRRKSPLGQMNEPALAGGRRRGGCIFGGGGEWMSGKG